ncbi:MAG: response regulator [Anaeromyxobacter sp.]
MARLLRPHEVSIETDGTKALERLRGGEAFDVVLCDLMMPDLTGMDLHDALVADHPEVARHLVFLTGGAFTDRAREFLARTRCPVLDKPVDAAALRDAVGRVMAP